MIKDTVLDVIKGGGNCCHQRKKKERKVFETKGKITKGGFSEIGRAHV